MSGELVNDYYFFLILNNVYHVVQVLWVMFCDLQLHVYHQKCQSLQSLVAFLLFSSASHEADFSTLHIPLIKKSGVKASDKKSITVSTAVKIIKGDLQKLRKDLAYMINKSTVTVDKLGFPDVIFPG